MKIVAVVVVVVAENSSHSILEFIVCNLSYKSLKVVIFVCYQQSCKDNNISLFFF